MTTRRRPAIWWRLLLAVSIIAAPLAITGGAAAGAWRGHVPPLQAHIHLSRVPVMAAEQLSALGHDAVHRLPGDSATALATGLIALVWFALATSIRRSGRVVRRAGPVQQSRAPPKRTALVVPFGPSSGRAGRFARSHLAHILPTHDSVCC